MLTEVGAAVWVAAAAGSVLEAVAEVGEDAMAVAAPTPALPEGQRADAAAVLPTRVRV